MVAEWAELKNNELIGKFEDIIDNVEVFLIFTKGKVFVRKNRPVKDQINGSTIRLAEGTNGTKNKSELMERTWFKSLKFSRTYSFSTTWKGSKLDVSLIERRKDKFGKD